MEKYIPCRTCTNCNNGVAKAAYWGHLYCMKYFIKNKLYDEHGKTHRGSTPLHLAAIPGHLDCVIYLMKRGHKIDIPDIDGETPLFLASIECHNSVIEYMINSIPITTSFINNILNIKNNKGKSALYFAAEYGNTECLQFFISKNVDLEPLMADFNTFPENTQKLLDPYKTALDGNLEWNQESHKFFSLQVRDTVFNLLCCFHRIQKKEIFPKLVQHKIINYLVTLSSQD